MATNREAARLSEQHRLALQGQRQENLEELKELKRREQRLLRQSKRNADALATLSMDTFKKTEKTMQHLDAWQRQLGVDLQHRIDKEKRRHSELEKAARASEEQLQEIQRQLSANLKEIDRLGKKVQALWARRVSQEEKDDMAEDTIDARANSAG
eukprot:TRINITY_DN4865_c0_g1_i1.p1 TRINITY_DN4865_c0_g1~~TRINITY_DN4865_c0_g1_i1.p1  ORF type:complete len:155 (-),score=57.66 TRINITY_DN4865_c0_g1_i1:29-493(-)